MNEEEIYSTSITKGHRTYFFDIKKSKQSKFYLVVTESKKTNAGFERHNIMVFEEDLNDFASIINKVLVKFNELLVPEVSNNVTNSFEKIRDTHRQAYLPWTKEDDKQLEILYCERKTISELSIIFGRNEGAISSRIKKLELKEKYE